MSAFPLPAAKPAPSMPALDTPALFDVTPYAGRPVSEISAQDLTVLGKRAWNHAARRALAQGHSVTIRVDGGLAEMTQDGRVTLPYAADEVATPRF